MPKTKHPQLRTRQEKTGLSAVFYADNKGDTITVRVIDNKTLRIKKEIPPAELQGIRDSLGELFRLLFPCQTS